MQMSIGVTTSLAQRAVIARSEHSKNLANVELTSTVNGSKRVYLGFDREGIDKFYEAVVAVLEDDREENLAAFLKKWRGHRSSEYDFVSGEEEDRSPEDELEPKYHMTMAHLKALRVLVQGQCRIGVKTEEIDPRSPRFDIYHGQVSSGAAYTIAQFGLADIIDSENGLRFLVITDAGRRVLVEHEKTGRWVWTLVGPGLKSLSIYDQNPSVG